MSSIVLENSSVRLVIGEDAVPKSLLYKPTGEELLYPDTEVSIFSVTQERPYNNENKLVYMNQRTTYQANSIRREGDVLSVGFEVAPYRALVDVRVCEEYIGFTLRGFDVPELAFGNQNMQKPPAVEFRLIQLPVRERKNFGKWLNVMWDDEAAVNVLATCEHAIVEADRRKGYRVMHASAMKACKRMLGVSAALIVSPTASLMDKIDRLERDFGLPLGVESRRDPRTHGSMYWTSSTTPENVDEQIAHCKAGGFTSMLLYYTCIFVSRGYSLLGDYDYRPEYPEGAESVRKMIDKIKAAGIVPGLHVLATHIGLESRYVTPVADHRLRIKRNFTLSRPLSETDTTVYVEEDPVETVIEDPKCRILRFGGEIISYEGYSTEPPYHFYGCHRGWLSTNKTTHPLGERGGLLDVSEYCAVSTYIDQDTSLQDEIADKLAQVYNVGFRFMYFDGAEGTNEPFGYYVSSAQQKIIRRMAEPPIFCTGAAKTHFGWHFMGGSNAFDTFKTEVFKEKIDEFPVRAAAELAKDFSIVNFGWWGFCPDTQPDTHEYGISRAIAWHCPVTVQTSLATMNRNPRKWDVLESLRRWHAARDAGDITEEMKAEIRTSGKEYTMLIDEEGRYEMREAAHLPIPGAPAARAYVFERCGRTYASIWSTVAEAVSLALPAPAFSLSYVRDLGGEEIALGAENGRCTVPVAERRYLSAPVPREAFASWLSSAVAE